MVVGVGAVPEVDGRLPPPKPENKPEVGAEVDGGFVVLVLSGAEVDGGFPPPKPENRPEFVVEVDGGLLPPEGGNKLGVEVEVDAGAAELGAAVEVAGGFPKRGLFEVVLAPPNMPGALTEDPGGFGAKRPPVAGAVVVVEA